MTKQDLIDAVANATGTTKVSASAAVQTVLDTIAASLKKGKSVTLIGFGTFTTVKRAARVATHPVTKTKIKVPARRAPKFVAGAALKAAVASSKVKKAA